MQRISSLVKKELILNLISLKGAFQLLFFLLVTGLFFYSFVSAFGQLSQDVTIYGGEKPDLNNLVQVLFSNMQFILLLVIPATTMGVISEEKSRQTIRLLFSSPISAAEIITAKFIASSLIATTIISLSTVYFAYLVYYGNPDVMMILSSYLGICLYTIMNISIGIYVSSKSNKQFISFLVTLLMMLFLLLSSWIVDKVSFSESASNLIQFIAVKTHLDPMLRGLIRLSDITYFLVLTFMFLTMATVSFKKKDWK